MWCGAVWRGMACGVVCYSEPTPGLPLFCSFAFFCFLLLTMNGHKRATEIQIQRGTSTPHRDVANKHILRGT